ncbi:hypothetical protein GOP47_0031219, partial [Adiantum capillus-veneris]
MELRETGLRVTTSLAGIWGQPSQPNSVGFSECCTPTNGIIMVNSDSEFQKLLQSLCVSSSALHVLAKSSRMEIEQAPLLEGRSASGRDKVTPYAEGGFFSILTFSWLSPLLSEGYRKPLHFDDIPLLAHADTAEEALRVLESSWSSIHFSSSASLLKCLALSYWKPALVSGCYAGVYTFASYIGPFLVNDFVVSLSASDDSSLHEFALVGLFFGAKVVESLAQRHWYFRAQQMGMRVRSLLTVLIYKKGLSMSSLSQQKHSSGEVVNYAGVDVQRIGDFSLYLHDTWLLPMHIVLSVSILYINLGLASIAGLLATAFTMLANLPFSKLQERFQSQIMKAKDTRMKATAEALKNMRILKLQAWELKFLEKIMALRSTEYKWLSRFHYTQAASLGLFWGAPLLVAIVTFGSCVILGVPLTTGRVLTALATLRIMQDPIRNLPDLVSMLTQTKVSLDRIRVFLNEQDICINDVDLSISSPHEAVAIELCNATFSWQNGHAVPTLRVPSLCIRRGMRVAVCGKVGSGKSSLLLSILGEIPKSSGTVKVCGRVAYVAQSPWIQTGTAVDNILFGKAMNRAHYVNVLQACALVKDLELFSHGEQTEIGERGINLSGGQKQRFQLARAIYQDADIYLLDDPFSAVDAHTGQHLFKECILGALANKTVIYVTHQVEFLPAADVVLVLQEGNIVYNGPYKELESATSILGPLSAAHATSSQATGADESYAHSKDMKQMSDELCNVDDVFGCMEDHEVDENAKQKEMVQLVQEEEKEIGKVSFSVYLSLIQAAYRCSLVPVILLAQTMFQCLQIASNYWLAWATPKMDTEEPFVSMKRVLGIYVILACGSTGCVLLRTISMAAVTLKTSQIFFKRMIYCIFHAPMSFFDSTPTGRILNRASTDQSAMDFDVTLRLGGVALSFIQLVGIFAVMSQAAWGLVLLFVPAFGICTWMQQYYVASARELARLVGVKKAPVLQHFGETISGAATIRALNKQHDFMSRNLQLIDHYSKPYFHNIAAMEWLCFRLDLLTNCIFTLSLLIIVSMLKDTIDPSIAGLAVTYGLNLNIIQSWLTWNLCNLENKIISAERIQQYTCIANEGPCIIENDRPPRGWPMKGTVNFINLKVRYGQRMPLVINGITCTVLGGTKIGIVGRTGSGKSTLIQALFRLVEPTEGKILIDGIDIMELGLHDLRTHLSIIPQDPTMFEGTLRFNLDPLEEHTDTEIWQALERSQLEHTVRARDQKLDAIVNENGENWSVGQRQLVCLGRALLKKRRILVLDEATASVDFATDSVIQNTIQVEFADSTVIAIAHRIMTVMNSDLVLVLSDGKVAEFDKPARLLKNSSSLFAKLVAEFSRRS